MKKAGDLVNIYFNEVQKKEGEQYNSFHNSWNEITGDKIGNNSEIKDIVDGNLIIQIDHPGWKQLILLKEKYILKKINKKFPELSVKKIKFYFKNSNKINDKTKDILKNTDINRDKVEIDNANFSELLKKMSKRSEE
ncbi:MAG: DUF721 domain-containing protein [Spirochaetaceae bacterium]